MVTICVVQKLPVAALQCFKYVADLCGYILIVRSTYKVIYKFIILNIIFPFSVGIFPMYLGFNFIKNLTLFS